MTFLRAGDPGGSPPAALQVAPLLCPDVGPLPKMSYEGKPLEVPRSIVEERKLLERLFLKDPYTSHSAAISLVLAGSLDAFKKIIAAGDPIL